MAIDSCPICFKSFSQLSQHLRVTHGIKNLTERKLLLALQSGRVSVREGHCPVPACQKETSRLDRHLKSHTELTVAARRAAVAEMKRKKVMSDLAALRATGPEVPMASTLDLEEAEGRAEMASGDEEVCERGACRQAREMVADLNSQVETLSGTLRELTRRFRKMQRRWKKGPAAHLNQVTRKLMGSFSDDREHDGEEDFVPPTPLQHPSTPPASSSSQQSIPNSPGRSGKSSPNPHFPDHVSALNVLMEQYRDHQEGPDPTPKLRENVSGKIYRIRKFMAYMAMEGGRLQTLEFLDNSERLRKWVSSLRVTAMKETTLNHYLKNVSQFLDYIAATPPPTCRLSKKAMLGIRREVKLMLRYMRRPVTVHQMSVKRKKDERLISKALLGLCRERSKAGINEKLEQLKSERSQKAQYLLYGYMTAFLASIYGHRCGVYQNMTIEEVRNAVHTSDTWLINVNMHKTNQAFGPAQIALSKEEYGWFTRFLEIKDDLVGGPGATFFFFTSSKKPCKNLNNYFQAAWADMGLPGSPTFTDLRSAIATHARNAADTESRTKMARFMCHDTRTADKFYACNLTAKQAWEHRTLFETALEGPDATPEKNTESRPKKASRKRPAAAVQPDSESMSSATTTEDEDEPVFQESGVSALESDESNSEDHRAGPSAIAQCRKLTVTLTPLKRNPHKRSIQKVMKSPSSAKSTPGKPKRPKVQKVFTPQAIAKAKVAQKKVKKMLKKRSQKKK
ncbi:uncharacterized protein [Paramisgurnus dabryanus]|uniref:uncharacterized protein n=1 Tax=Paramisgurnus dabryanus TaxID=90735 RepID=UPI0031F404BA